MKRSRFFAVFELCQVSVPEPLSGLIGGAVLRAGGVELRNRWCFSKRRFFEDRRFRPSCLTDVFLFRGHREVDAKLPSLNMEPKRPETLSKGRKVSFLSKRFD